MRWFFALLGLLFIIVFILGLAIILIVAIYQVIVNLHSLDNNIKGIIIAAFVTLIASILTVQFTKAYERKKEYQNELRRRKTEIYTEIINFFFRILFAGRPGIERVSEKDLQKVFNRIFQGILLWSPKKVVVAFGNFRKEMSENDQTQDTTNKIKILGDLINVMRQDLGHDTGDLDYSHIFNVFIKDVENINLK